MRLKCLLWRWMISLARATVSALALARPISEAALLIADSGLRSSPARTGSNHLVFGLRCPLV